MRGKNRPKANRTIVSPVGQILSTEEVARLMGVSQRTIQALIQAGKLQALKVGKNYRILDKHIQAFFAQQETTAPDDVA